MKVTSFRVISGCLCGERFPMPSCRTRPLGVSDRGRDDAHLLEMGDHFLGQRVRVLLAAFQAQLGLCRRLVGVVDSRESLDLAGTGFLVEAFRITLLTNLDRGVDEDLLEIAVVQGGPNRVAVTDVGADEGGQRDHPGLAEQLRDRADTADVLLAILGGEAQAEPFREFGPVPLFEHFRAGIEPIADVVSVQQKAAYSPLVELLLDDVGDRALAAAAQPGEPDDTALVPVEALALGAAYLMFVPSDVVGHFQLLSHSAAHGRVHEAGSDLLDDERDETLTATYHRSASPVAGRLGIASARYAQLRLGNVAAAIPGEIGRAPRRE